MAPAFNELHRSIQFKIALLILACAVASLLVIWTRIATVNTTYSYIQNQKDLHRLQQELQGERVQWLKLTSPRKLETLARHIGLSPPKVAQIVRLRSKAVKNPAGDQ